MILDRRRFVAAAAASALAGPAVAQGFPNRVVKIIVPFAAAGAVDAFARMVGGRLGEIWQQQVVVENKPGAGGNIGNELVARAEPDGYTLLFTQAGITINPFLYPSLGYDPVKDFAPVSLLAVVPNVMVVPAGSPAKTAREFIAYAKTKHLAYGSAGNGSSSHLSGEMFKRIAGVELTHVPYRGSSLALNDLLAGRLDVMFDNVSTVVPHMESGALRGLGVTTKQPVATLPHLRPLTETEVPGFNVAGAVTVLLPAKTPADIVAKTSRDVVAALMHPPIKTRLEQLGTTLVGSTPEGMAQWIKSEMDAWGPVIRDAKIRIETN